MQTPQTPFQPSALAQPERILVASDLTDSEFLLPHAIAQAKESNAGVTLLHAIPASYIVPRDPSSIPYVDGPKILRDSRLLLLGMAQQVEAAGVACDVVCRPGDPLALVQQEIEEHGATRVVMGTHGRGKLGQFVMGSVAHELVQKLDVPVFVVGERAHSPAHGIPRCILHPVSLLGDYRQSVDLAVELAQAWKAELILLHVFDGDIHQQADPVRRIEWARTALADLVPDEMYLTAPVQTVAAFGKIPEEIVRTAAEYRADWIVMGVNANSKFFNFKEDAAYLVIASAECPVLTVRHAAQPCKPVAMQVIETPERPTPSPASVGVF